MNRAFSRKKDKTWMHTPEALSKHFIPYNAKFLGSTEVEQPKGTEVVRDAVRKLKFARHIKKSEGQKIPKVELQISIYGVKILEPKTKEVQHNCQLHRISFCADDKTDKRIFTFICKDSESNKHLCYVFDSEKCAEEITLTIGQAFDLAYRKFLESGGKDVETRKQIAGLQKRSSRSSRCWIQDLETENMELKNKVQDLENQLRITQVSTSPLLHDMSDHEQHGFQRCSSSFWRSSGDSSPCLNISSMSVTPVNSPDSRLSLGLLIPPPSKCGFPKPVSESSIPRPHAGSMTPQSPSTDIFDMIPFSPISHQSSMPTRNGTQPPPVPSRSTEIKRDLFGAEPFDPFNCGAADFPPDIQSKLDEMQEGFKMGLTLEGTVFCLDPLDSRC
ncbi:PTB domain-containing engulfment adapter protein 1 isoform X1 [Macaca nemestrina]|uniref:PTB domain-containing engulfment adapter protein 1 n=1 Tax=Macaca fascicularis TaxID=9541 RepID=A0A2K5VL48_MACFA|nr:PTB domain-containing engulfment adapter protein 1 isoform X1 [Macaca fascicularis]XP_045223298.1 PTB domain-containing engulfment adapter protein 1 isoform X1 [Macaca fascicularis]XP_045223299.1 PTB domain-containing engulfment adapter protein 1 isoform X1 [Macaca fascicularis]XP_045223300.1 PTB domain-containing engulfment adapter protein 1 isoform X1 [Macaca fascicularis]XP_045223301.1 PTB domain-containing engulfment adapter protein 1 isoform X1 [Macaca fascicularis]XP_045223302.1 PTB d